jgi:hypothetical protein
VTATTTTPAVRYRRTPTGYTVTHGGQPVAFLERGAPMSDTGHACWLIHVVVRPEDVEVDHLYAGLRISPWSGLRSWSDLTMKEGPQPQGDAWTLHAGDEGWLTDAKHVLPGILAGVAEGRYWCEAGQQ